MSPTTGQVAAFGVAALVAYFFVGYTGRLHIARAAASAQGGHQRCQGPQRAEEIHVIYAMCGGDHRLEELFVSVASLFTMARASEKVYCLHIIHDGSVLASRLAFVHARYQYKPASLHLLRSSHHEASSLSRSLV